MKWPLLDFQTDAVAEVLTRLQRAKQAYLDYGEIGAFALSATTGAGKTVMATAVFEALFYGSEEFDFEADPTAVVLWVTDDPFLNEQTKDRILEAGGGKPLGYGELEVIDDGFEQELFDPQRIYFLNIQKLAATSHLVRVTDQRHITLWDTIRNTIEHPQRTLYLVLDEAHRGMRRAADPEARPTIVQRLVNGHSDVPPAPIVWGISATIARFDAAMKAANAKGRVLYPNVEVDSARVQKSGLLKDTICLDFPDEKGDFETTLLKSAVSEVREIGRIWDEYAEREGLADPVVPLLVVQVPNTPKDRDLIRYLDTIYDNWPDLGYDAVANVFGERQDLQLGPYEIPYIPPQKVQESTHIRVLLAKDAITTGWDCPRAEVMISFRGALDPTYITQLLGRMVRTPLARRIESVERLNSVTCVLPKFNRPTAIRVAEILTGEVEVDEDPDAAANKGMGRRVIIKPVDVDWNPHIPAEVREVFANLPSEAAPKGNKKPIQRLLAVAAAFALDELRPDPNKEAREAIYAALDGLMAEHAAKVEEGVAEIFAADIRRYVRRMANGGSEEHTRTERGDERTVADAFRAATRTLGAAIANGYVRRLVDTAVAKGEDVDVVAAQARLAALVQIEGAVEEVERKADALADSWLQSARVEIKGLAEDRQALYREFTQQGTQPKKVDIVVPGPDKEAFYDDKGKAYRTFDLHVISDKNGKYPLVRYTQLELQVLETELGRPGVVAWYRNPSSGSADALRVPYEVGEGVWKSMQPDFIFFSRNKKGRIEASIVDPHSAHLSDALPKLKGLARFAELYGDQFARIDAIAEVDGEIRVLDMTQERVRKSVVSATGANAEPLYVADVSVDYS